MAHISTPTPEQLQSMSKPLVAIRSGAGTDVGRRREENQDSFGIIENQNYKLYVVADGMGGAKGGAIASQLAISTIKESLADRNTVTPDIIAELILEANDTIFQRSLEDSGLSGMGTTLVALLFVGTSLHIFNVGDSRAYRLRGDSLERLTEDHTLVSELVRAGAITESQAENHPVSHMLTRSLGPSSEVAVDKRTLPDGPIRGDRYLLCSDGLYNMVSNGELEELLNLPSIDECIEMLLRTGNEHGGTDNITALIVEITDDYPVGIEDITSDVSKLYKKEAKKEPVQVNNQNAQTEATQQAEAKSSRASMRAIGLFGFIVFVGGLFIGSFVNRAPQPQKISNAGNLSPVSVPTIKSLPQQSPVISTTLFESSSELLSAAKESASESTAGSNLSLGEVERSNIERRLQSVLARLESVRTKISYLSPTVQSSLPSLLQSNQLQLEAIEKRASGIRDQLEVSARLLSVWYGRKKRMDVEDPISLAGEVSVTAPEVRSKKEEFEAVTWEYLQAAEQLRVRPSDIELEKRVSDLVRLRQEKVKELIGFLRESIDRALSSADKQISELTLEQDELQKESQRLKNDNEFMQSLVGATDEFKEKIRQDLASERDALEKEQSELSSLLMPYKTVQ